MKNIVVGILAHVDAGKTTLSESLLYRSGQLRSLGRVDHGDAFLDTERMEKQRGITIFSKQAVIRHENTVVTLLDTPGHIDFSAEMERTLRVLDYAILVVNATDPIQGYTQTLWRLLARYQIPTFVFVNKMDATGADRQWLLSQLNGKCSDGCFDFTIHEGLPSIFEDIATLDEMAMDEYLESDTIEDHTIQSMIAQRKLFPCYFGSALKVEGIDEFLDGLRRFTTEPAYSETFGARIYKISHDTQGNRLTWMKITGGTLPVKTLLSNVMAFPDPGLDSGGGDGNAVCTRDAFDTREIWSEKVDQIRIYSGAKFEMTDTATVGSLCAVTGLTKTFPGEGLGFESDGGRPVLEPVLTYTVMPRDQDVHTVLVALHTLEDEDPLLQVRWQERLQEIRLQLMGAVQLEIVQQMLRDRFGLDVEFSPGSIMYKETIEAPVEGVGHFEPLRHYAEVHVLLEPTEPGSGVSVASACSLDVLDRNWQRLILNHLREKEYVGVLTGSPITDMRITLITGRGHLKHTEGGDFRQATYRAVRQGLMKASNRVLEPWYAFRVEVPQDLLGHAMSDIQRMSGKCNPLISDGDYAVLTGEAPVSQMRDYAMELNAYTHGQGHITCVSAGYRPCHNESEVVEHMAYDPESDLENTPDSVFCAHGAGYTVKWNRVEDFMHIQSND